MSLTDRLVKTLISVDPMVHRRLTRHLGKNNFSAWVRKKEREELIIIAAQKAIEKGKPDERIDEPFIRTGGKKDTAHD